MALTCPDCGMKVDLTEQQRRRNAGKWFACPKCGAKRKLPPIEESSVPKPIKIVRQFQLPIAETENCSEDDDDKRQPWHQTIWARALFVAIICEGIAAVWSFTHESRTEQLAAIWFAVITLVVNGIVTGFLMFKRRTNQPLSKLRQFEMLPPNLRDSLSITAICGLMLLPTIALHVWSRFSETLPVSAEIFVAINIGTTVTGLLLWWFIQPTRQRYFWMAAAYVILTPLVSWKFTDSLPAAVVLTCHFAVVASFLATFAFFSYWVLWRWPLIRWFLSRAAGWFATCWACCYALGPILEAHEVSLNSPFGLSVLVWHGVLVPTLLYLGWTVLRYRKAELNFSDYPRPKSLNLFEGAIVGMAIGLWGGRLIGMFWPIFGGFWLVGQLGSLARQSLLPFHMFVFGMLGTVVGCLVRVPWGRLFALVVALSGVASKWAQKITEDSRAAPPR